jgi:hypothetical protein
MSGEAKKVGKVFAGKEIVVSHTNINQQVVAGGF